MQNMIDIKEVWLLWFTIFFDKKSKGCSVNNEIKQNEQIAEELNKPIIKKLKWRVYSSFKNNIWDTDLADMQLISNFNKGTRFVLSVIYMFSKHPWVIPLKYKKDVTVVDAFHKIWNNSKKFHSMRIPNKIWVD